MFIYHALFEAFTCGITSIDVSKFTEENQKLLRSTLHEKRKNGYQLQYDVRRFSCKSKYIKIFYNKFKPRKTLLAEEAYSNIG